MYQIPCAIIVPVEAVRLVMSLYKVYSYIDGFLFIGGSAYCSCEALLLLLARSFIHLRWRNNNSPLIWDLLAPKLQCAILSHG